MSLRSMKSAHKLGVVGFAGMVQEQPATGLAGMEKAELCINIYEICDEYAVICKT